MAANPANPMAAHMAAQKKLADGVAAESDADVYLYAGPVYPPAERLIRQCVEQNRSRKNALVYLTSFGGSPDTAYRVARCLQSHYAAGRLSIYVLFFCKSAGTLIAIGAHELVMADDSELGPLDVQLAKPDAVGERISGLTPVQALDTLRTEAFKCFEKCFLEIIERSDGQVGTPTASAMAVRMATGLFRPIYGQMDPMRLGEYQRSMLIADRYGKRLNEVADNLKLKNDALSRLIADYPSHGFVIDPVEAKTLFQRVRKPTEKELALARVLELESMRRLADQNPDAPPLVRCVTTKVATADAKEPSNDRRTATGQSNGVVSPPAGKAGGGTAAPGEPSGRTVPRRRPAGRRAGGDGRAV